MSTATEDPRQILMHPKLVPAFEAWLASRGLELHCIGKFSDDDLPTWVVSPTDAALSAASAQSPDSEGGA